MPWQLWVLVTEAIVSAVVAAVFITNGHINRIGRHEAWLYLAWDVTLIPLLLTGADALNLGLSWQHTLLLVAYFFTAISALQRVIRKEKKEPKVPTGSQAGAALFCTLVGSAMIALVVTGAP